MKAEVGECVTQRQRDRFRHVAASGKSREELVAEISVLKRFTKDLAKIERADYRIVVYSADEKILIRFLCRIQQQYLEPFTRVAGISKAVKMLST